MKRLVWLLLIGASVAQTTIAPKTTIAANTTLFFSPPATTFTLVQHPTAFSCTASPCVITTSSTTAGNLLVLWSAVRYTGTGFAKIMAMNSATDNGTSETWTHCPNSVINNASSSDATLYGADCYYILSAAGGATTVSAGWDLEGLTGSSFKIDATLEEYHPSATPIFYDTGNAFYNTASCSSCSGPAGLLSGTSDVVSQAAIWGDLYGGTVITGITAPYSNPADFENTNHIYAGFAGALNQASYSRPTWTSGAFITPFYFSSVAFSGNATPAPTANMLIDFSGCSNGSALTAVCLQSSVFTGWDSTTAISNMGSGVTAVTSVISSNLPATTTVNGVAKTGGSTLDFKGVTAVSGTAVGYVDIGLSSAAYAPLTMGYTFRSTCPANVECGASVRLIDTNGNYAMAHISPLGAGNICLESTNGGSCQTTGVSYAINTNYRINVQMAGTTGTTDKITVCNDSTGAVLGTATATSAAANGGINDIQIGITGEEPTTAGYIYYIRNVVVGGTYSTTSCF